MFGWADIILAALRLALSLTTWARENRLIAAGKDAAIGQAAKDVLAATAWGNEIGAKIDAMDKARLEDLTDALGGADGAAG
jgi:hypothetical protein